MSAQAREGDDLAALLNREVWSKLRLKPPTGARPILSASLILVDRTGREPRVLMGRRHEQDRFMPSKYVFPGGRLDPQVDLHEDSGLRHG